MGKHIEDFTVGDVSVTGARTVTEADVVAFAGISGDYNRLHTDADFCRNTLFGTRIAHGLLGLAIATGLDSRLGELEGTALAFLSIENWKFIEPIHFGDTIHVRETVIEARPTSKPGRGVLKQKYEIINQRGKVVQSGVFVVLVSSRAQDVNPS
jgi:acyl dehydratase